MVKLKKIPVTKLDKEYQLTLTYKDLILISQALKSVHERIMSENQYGKLYEKIEKARVSL